MVWPSPHPLLLAREWEGGPRPLCRRSLRLEAEALTCETPSAYLYAESRGLDQIG